MGLYNPTTSPTFADPAAAQASWAAQDAAMIDLFQGTGVISGLTLATSGAISAGKALCGHIVAEPGGTIIPFSGTGTFDLYVAPPAFQQPSGAPATPGTYPNASGRDAPAYTVVPTGAAGPTNGAMLATVTVSNGVISGVNNAPSGRNSVVPPSQIGGIVSKLLNPARRVSRAAELTASCAACVPHGQGNHDH